MNRYMALEIIEYRHAGTNRVYKYTVTPIPHNISEDLVFGNIVVFKQEYQTFYNECFNIIAWIHGKISLGTFVDTTTFYAVGKYY